MIAIEKEHERRRRRSRRAIGPTDVAGNQRPVNSPAIASPSVTAGLMCAPLIGPTHHTATNTAMPQPNVITIQPEPLPLVFGSTTLATTPLPSRISSAVPTNSASKSS